MLHVEPLFRNLDGISSQKYNRRPPPFEFLSNLYGVQNPFNLNWAEENESSSLVSEISNMSILVSMMKDNASNLFLIKLMAKNYLFRALVLNFSKSNFCINNIVVFSTIE